MSPIMMVIETKIYLEIGKSLYKLNKKKSDGSRSIFISLCAVLLIENNLIASYLSSSYPTKERSDLIQNGKGEPTPDLKEDPMAHVYVFGVGFGLGVGGSISWKFHRNWTGTYETFHGR